MCTCWCKESGNSIAQSHLDVINKLVISMNSYLERDLKENDWVHLMRISTASSLAALPESSYVKSVPLRIVLETSKDKFFSETWFLIAAQWSCPSTSIWLTTSSGYGWTIYVVTMFLCSVNILWMFFLLHPIAACLCYMLKIIYRWN